MAELVADFILKRLRDWGVHRIYGYPGDGINGIIGALDRASQGHGQVVAVVGLLLAGLLVEPTINALLPEVGRYGPFTALPTAAADIPAEDAGLGDVDLLAPALAVLALLAWIGAAFAGGYALLRGRDVH